MKLAFLLCLFMMFASCGSNHQIGPEILGVRLGMNKGNAHERLQSIGEIENKLNKQQEVWRLKSDSQYSHLIVAYNKEYTSVRFITAIAKDGGQPVRYSDVIDIANASRTETGNNFTYTLESNKNREQAGYLVIAKGTDPQFLKYYSVKSIGGEMKKEEEEDH
jgi:hypothetical protein